MCLAVVSSSNGMQEGRLNPPRGARGHVKKSAQRRAAVKLFPLDAPHAACRSRELLTL